MRSVDYADAKHEQRVACMFGATTTIRDAATYVDVTFNRRAGARPRRMM